MQELTIPHLNNGEKEVSAKMFTDSGSRIMISRLSSGASIGVHEYLMSRKINYVINGEGKAMCDGHEEESYAGMCNFCPIYSSHGIINTGADDLVLFTVVAER